MIDRLLLISAVVALVTASLISARWGAVALGLVFLTGALLRRRGATSLLIAQRRQHTDVVVLSAFGLALIALAAVLP